MGVNSFYYGMKNPFETYWTAFYTKPRSEKKVAERLMEEGFNIYCPTRTVLKQWSDRKKKVREPLFTSYVFARVDEEERLQILQDTGIVRNVTWLGKPVNIPQQEIDLIKQFLGEFPHAQANDKKDMREGDAVEVKEGVFKGEKGNVFKVKGTTVVLFLQTLNHYLHAEISINQVEVLN